MVHLNAPCFPQACPHLGQVAEEGEWVCPVSSWASLFSPCFPPPLRSSFLVTVAPKSLSSPTSWPWICISATQSNAQHGQISPGLSTPQLCLCWFWFQPKVTSLTKLSPLALSLYMYVTVTVMPPCARNWHFRPQVYDSLSLTLRLEQVSIDSESGLIPEKSYSSSLCSNQPSFPRGLPAKSCLISEMKWMRHVEEDMGLSALSHDHTWAILFLTDTRDILLPLQMW